LKAGREIRRLAHDPALLGLARAYEIADYDQSGSDSNPHRLGRSHGPNRLDERLSGPHGTLSIILMRLRIAEIDQHPLSRATLMTQMQ
jgi:hypothetical protein